jgi:hypothetical protein
METLRRLFPRLFGPYAKCMGCGRVRLRSEMYRPAILGLFCTKGEADAHMDTMREQ